MELQIYLKGREKKETTGRGELKEDEKRRRRREEKEEEK